MNYPAWLGDLSKKDELLRKFHGLQPSKDGWYKKVLGKKRYIAKPMALAEVVTILDARVDEIKGNGGDRVRPLSTGATTIEGLSEMFIAHLWQRVQTGTPRKMARRTYDDYVDVLGRFVDIVGPTQPAAAINPTWFSRYMRTLTKRAVSTQRREIIYLTAFFNWAGPGRHSLNFYKDHVQFGPDFRKPDESRVRAEAATYSTLFTPEQFRESLNAVAPSPMLYAVGLLALNCAFLPEDLAALPMSAVNMETGVVEFPRGKTGIARKAVLMPETIAAIRRYFDVRPTGPDVAPFLFVRDDGRPYSERKDVGPKKRAVHSHAIAQYWNDIATRPLKGLRTTFATEADGVVDQAAVDLVMGHAAKTIRSKHYVKQFADERIRAVIEHVWSRVGPIGPLPSVAWIAPFSLARRVGRRAAALAKPRSRRPGSRTAAV